MTTSIYLRAATAADICHVAACLREADRIELTLAQAETPAEAVRLSAAQSDWTTCVLVNGKPAVLYGVCPGGGEKNGDIGVPWMLATDDIGLISREFIQGCPGEVARMQAGYRLLINQVHCANRISIRWLRWLGFYVDETPTGPCGAFFNFWRSRRTGEG